MTNGLALDSEISSTDSGAPRIHKTAVVELDVEIGDGTAVWHFTHVLSGSRIGANCVLGQNVMVGPNVSIGSGCKIQNNVSVYEGVTFEDGVFVGPSAVFTNDRNPRAFGDWQLQETRVCRGASIGANATVVCGITIGEFALIGAGSVVTSNVPAYALMIGNPARQVGWVNEAGHQVPFPPPHPAKG